MPKEKGKKHKEILKCSRCRLDKQKCLPEGRTWPGTKCNRCQEHGYQCSQPLSARNEKIEREAEEEELVRPHISSQNRLSASNKSKSLFLEQDDFALRLPSSSASPPPRGPEVDVPVVARKAGQAMRPTIAMIREPPAYRIIDSNSSRLMERFADFWGSPMTFGSMCSPEFAHMVSTLFRVDSRQISLVDDMTNNAVMAFSAGDAALTQSPQWPVFTNMTHAHAMRAMSLLRERLKQSWPYLKDASIVLTAFNLFCYGLCVSDAMILQFMTAIIQTYHRFNTGFPLNAEIVTGDNGFWIVRLFMADNPDDRGLIMQHNTNTFARERVMFEERSGFYSPTRERGSTPDESVPILASNVNPVVSLTVTDIAAEVQVPVNPTSPYPSTSPPSSAHYSDSDPMSVDMDNEIDFDLDRRLHEL
ncbi:hypothetical protein TWF696_008050 [Orbilia brochopaga]|uniref:Zn(2)-C6 fungal-type domain-containing protein n=1 Tax=Orbilia brochopaga TaxID=3140254 RepID=A0AAV9UNF3_9PEZI